MRYHKILNRLINKYEMCEDKNCNVKAYCTIDVEKFFTEYDSYTDLKEDIKELVRLHYVETESSATGSIKSITIIPECIDSIYGELGREPYKGEHEWINDLWDALLSYEKDGGEFMRMMREYISVQKYRISIKKPVEYYEGEHTTYMQILRAVKHAVSNDKEIYMKDFSVRVFGDDKVMERIRTQVKDFLYEYGNYEDPEFTLEECGIVYSPTYIPIKGKCIITFISGEEFNLTNMPNGIAMSQSTISNIKEIKLLGSKFVTIENMPSFVSFDDPEACSLFIGGLHNRLRVNMIKKIYASNPNIDYFHFGDTDPAGFEIFNNLCDKTGINFKTLMMDIQTLELNKESWKKLKKNDVCRCEKLIEMLDEKEIKGVPYEDYRCVIQYMSENKCKLEQEILRKI